MTFTWPKASMDLHDLPKSQPELVEARGGIHTGLFLTSLLGVGGMSTVFLAETKASQNEWVRDSSVLAPNTPPRVAVKVMQASTVHQLLNLGIDPSTLVTREVVALARVAERAQPCPYVIAFYGCGLMEVEVAGSVRSLPWIAIEAVDEHPLGLTLSDRVAQTGGGLPPSRTLQLAKGIFEGVRVLHEERSIHRDLKPGNVLVVGNIPHEVPKIADCGIARVDGLATARVGAFTEGYAAPEQVLSGWLGETPNPLIGPWTDVHALASVIWFVMAGEEWCSNPMDWLLRGHRRSLVSASRRHAAIATGTLLERLDAVLVRAASPSPPEKAWANADETFRAWATSKIPSLTAGVPRYANVEDFAADLFPLLLEATLSQPGSDDGTCSGVDMATSQPTRLMVGQDLSTGEHDRPESDAPPPVLGSASTKNE